MSLLTRIGRLAAVLTATAVSAGVLTASPASAVDPPPAKKAVESTVDFFADSYPTLGAKSVFVSTPYEYLTDILKSEGTYAIVFGSPEKASTQNAIKHIDEAARHHGIKEVYHFDPLLGGDVLDITDPVNSVAYASNNYYKLYTDLRNQLVNIDPAYSGSSDTYVFTYNKSHKNSGGLSAPIISGVVEDATDFATDAESDAFHDALDDVFAAAGSGAQFDVRPQFDYFRTTHTAKGNDSSIIQEADREGWVLEVITYPQLEHLLKSNGSHTIVTGNAWCPNARAVFRYLNAEAKANGVKKVYVFDPRLDGSSNALSITNDENRFNFLDARLIDGYFKNAKTDIDNPKLQYLPDGDTSKPKVESENRKFLNPFLFQYQKDAKDPQGRPRPLTQQWVYEDENGPQEYQLVWARTKDGIGTDALTKQGIADLKDFFVDVGKERPTLVADDPGDVPRQGRASSSSADGCGDEDDLIDHSGSETLLPNSGTTDYDVKHYDIDVEYKPVKPSSKTSVTATTKITAKASKPLSSVSLDFRRLKINSIKVDGAAAANFQQVNIDHEDKQKLVVVPATAIADGAEFTVEVSYTTGTIDAFKRDGESNQGFFPSQNSQGASALGQPFGSTYWFPNNNSTTDRATYRIALTAPRDLTGVTIGVLESTKARGNTVTRTWVQDSGVVPYQTLASFGDYKEFIQPVELKDGRKISLRSYADRTLYNSSTVNQTTIEKQIQSQPSIVEWGEGRFGAYPGVTGGAVYEELLNADLQPVAFGGVETNGRIFYSRIPGGNTFVHEYIHQWFGDGVTIASYNDLWLSEGFATYFANVYYEDTAGLDLKAKYQTWFADNVDPEFWQTAPGSLHSESDLFSNAVYGRGGYVLAALRAAVGDADFFEIVQQWQSSKQGGSGSTSEFVELAEQVSGRSLDRVLKSWLYDSGRPAALPTRQLPTVAPTTAGKPTAVVSDRAATLTWSAPAGADDLQVTDYVVTLSTGDSVVGDSVTVDAAALSHTFEGLAEGTYSATVSAVNAAGKSPESEPSDTFRVGSEPPVEVEPVATTVKAAAAGSTAFGRKTVVAVTLSEASATGRVNLELGGRTVGTAQASSGRANVAVDSTVLKVGANKLKVVYVGDAKHGGSSTQITVKVVKATAKVSAKLSKTKVTVSQRPVVTVKVTAPGLRPTGRVRVSVNGASKVVTLKNGTAKVRLGKLSKRGTKKITVQYLGSSQVKSGRTTTKVKVVK